MAGAASIGTGSRTLDDLAEVIGHEAVFALAWAFRGERLYIPKDPANAPRIAEAIGSEAAQRLCDVFWRMTIYMPMREATRLQVHRLAGEGMTRRDIARRLSIAERQVYRLLESPPTASLAIGPLDDRQLSLL